MGSLKKTFIIGLCLLTLNLYMPGTPLASGVKPSTSVITEAPIEIRSTPGMKGHRAKAHDKRTWFSRNKWWVIGGLLVVGGAAAAGGGGGGGGSDSPGPEKPATSDGSYSFSW